MDDTVKTIDYKGFEIKIKVDDMDFETPRDWDNLGTMVCFHNNYSLGDKTELESSMFDDFEDLKNYLKEKEEAFIIIPLYLYDHSGITMNTTGFSCGWDSGQVGFIYTTKEKIRECFGVKLCRKEIVEKAMEVLQREVKVYDDYLTGNVYGFVTFKDGEEESIDSCWGFYGDYDSDDSQIVIEAKSCIDYEIERRNKKASFSQAVQLNKLIAC